MLLLPRGFSPLCGNEPGTIGGAGAHCGDIVFGNEPGTNGGAGAHCGDIVFGSSAQPERIFRFGSGEQSERIFRLRMDLGAGDRIPRWSRPQVLGRIR